MRVLEAANSSLRTVGLLFGLVIAFGLSLGIGLTASGVLASHEGDDTIHACVNPFSKVARIVEDPARCAYYDDLVEWQGAASSAALEARVAELETLLACVQSEAGVNPAIADIVFTGCNVHVRSGSGGTAGPINGLGNLIVGYNEDNSDSRTGSHNLVVGQFHSYSSFGGLVAGRNNVVSGANSTVSGGVLNTASGEGSSVSGGGGNTASGGFSSVSGGNTNAASGNNSSVSGGALNIASEAFSSVSGGEGNEADGSYSSVSGGHNRVISDLPFADHAHDWRAGISVADN